MTIEPADTWDEIDRRPNFNTKTKILHEGQDRDGCNAGEYGPSQKARVCGDSIRELREYAKEHKIVLRDCGRCLRKLDRAKL